MKYSSLTVVSLCLIPLLSKPVFAEDIRVTNGAELQDALDHASTNGEDDTIVLAAGTYWQEKRGSPGRHAYFKYISTTEHHSLTIMGAPGTTARDVVLDGYFDGYVLKIEVEPGFRPEPSGEINVIGLTIKNGNRLYHNTAGLSIGAVNYDVTVRDCVIRDNISESGLGGGVRIRTNHHVVFENNVVLWNRVTPRIVNGSEILCSGGGAYIHSFADPAIIRNNVFAYNRASGDESCWGGGVVTAGGCTQTINFVHNTVYGNSAEAAGGYYTYINRSKVLNLYNNIIWGNSAANPHLEDLYTLGSGEINAFNNNIHSSLSLFTASGGNMDVDPLFVSTLFDDFHLQSHSPLVDQGENAVPDPGLPGYDFEGDPRVCSSAPDIGADEACRSSGPETSLQLPMISEMKILKPTKELWDKSADPYAQ